MTYKRPHSQSNHDNEWYARRMRRLVSHPVSDLGKAREAAGVSRAAIADMLGVSYAVVYLMERRRGVSDARRREYLDALAVLAY